MKPCSYSCLIANKLPNIFSGQAPDTDTRVRLNYRHVEHHVIDCPNGGWELQINQIPIFANIFCNIE